MSTDIPSDGIPLPSLGKRKLFTSLGSCLSKRANLLLNAPHYASPAYAGMIGICDASGVNHDGDAERSPRLQYLYAGTIQSAERAIHSWGHVNHYAHRQRLLIIAHLGYQQRHDHQQRARRPCGAVSPNR